MASDEDILALLRSLRVSSSSASTSRRFTCALDGRSFRSQEALAQHTRDSHRPPVRTAAVREDTAIDPSTLPSPVSSPGWWVTDSEFLASGRNKSFGYFVCKDCGKWWVSAHAQRKQLNPRAKSILDTFFFQQCKACSTEALPMFMWENAEARQVDSGDDGDSKPHEAALCEACRLGMCTLGTDY